MLRELVKKNSFLLTLVALCLLCFALSGAAKADVKGIPFNAAFESASFPHARVVSGCTAWRRPQAMGDQWGPVSFAGACQLNDLCYHSMNSSWGDCNQRFMSDLRASCDRDLKLQQIEKHRTGEPDAQAILLCYEIAGMYFSKVQEPAARQRFELAQTQQVAYFNYVRSVVAKIYKSAMGRKPSLKELDRALALLASDHGLDELRTGLMGAKLDMAQSPEDPAAGDGGPEAGIQPVAMTPGS